MNLFNYIELISEAKSSSFRGRGGKNYEIEKIKEHKYEGSDSHTAHFDAVQKTEKFLVFFKKAIPAIDVSIKFSKYERNNIDLADYFRIASVNKDFILHVGFWEGSENNIVEEFKIKILKNNWKNLFPKFTKQDLDKFQKEFLELRKLKNNGIDKAELDTKIKELKKNNPIFFSNSSEIKIALKNSTSTNQFRFQGSISRNNFLEHIVTEENGNVVYYHKVERGILKTIRNLFFK